MKDRPAYEARMRVTHSGATSHDNAFGAPPTGDAILGLRAFEKISAVEGIRLSAEMRRDLVSLDAMPMDDALRSRFVMKRYGGA